MRDEILNGSFKGCLIDHISAEQSAMLTSIGGSEVSFHEIYHNKPVLDIELSGYKIMETLMNHL